VDNRARYVTQRNDERWAHVSPLWHIIPGMIAEFDFPDLLAACAPMPLLITEGGPQMLLERVAGAYDAADARQKFTYHYYPAYADPESRVSDGVWPPPEGMTEEEWLHFANVDVPNHCFKGELAVPWLSEQLDLR